MELHKINNTLISLVEKEEEIQDSLNPLATEWTTAARDYRVAKARRIMEMKDAGMAITLIDKLVDGEENISELKFNMDLKEELLKNARLALDTVKKNISVYQSLLKYSEEV